jgi:hypothetical protein
VQSNVTINLRYKARIRYATLDFRKWRRNKYGTSETDTTGTAIERLETASIIDNPCDTLSPTPTYVAAIRVVPAR